MAWGRLRGVPLVTPNTLAQVLTPTHTLAIISRHKQTTASTVRPTPSGGRLNNPSGIKSAMPVLDSTGLTMGGNHVTASQSQQNTTNKSVHQYTCNTTVCRHTTDMTRDTVYPTDYLHQTELAGYFSPQSVYSPES